jgi:hypothetical protein
MTLLLKLLVRRSWPRDIKLQALKSCMLIKEIAEEDHEVLESCQAFREFVIKSASLMIEA